ncbi:nitrate reductase molybdenum cofactor assembly chaperone [Mycobacterium sherrisii]|uniref:Nitrate reductase molybdenum cofactor assembly chaperone n=1 Tax=Mycobacterium sherrisii TaxID=243061 RepID=A0A1E3S8J1_9MYCO|nr:nitrate reductase molybdenum cofactor assembly chaperone [Mycobacterium sherrisii]ODQ98485.1 nitrate reductase molybdenum cofactor assembly chaperone [Mycobacterium sherrisii]
MKIPGRARAATLADRLVWQCASLLLHHPDQQRLNTAAALLDHVEGLAAKHLSRTVVALRSLDPMRAAQEYVATFDLRRRCTMYLTYWTAGDTRNRGAAMLAFANTYRAAGAPTPRDEAPDYLPVVLEFAATVDADAGRGLLNGHRVAVDLLHQALYQTGSIYAPTVEAVLATLPARTGLGISRAQRLAQEGPPGETVGLQPFTLTVPPRRI